MKQRANMTILAALLFPLTLLVLTPALAEAQDIYVANREAGSISIFDPDTLAEIGVFDVGGSPSDLAITPDGLLAYVADADAGSVSVVDLSTHTLIAVIEDLIPPAIQDTRRYQTLQALVNCTRRSLLPDTAEGGREKWVQEIRSLEREGVR